MSVSSRLSQVLESSTEIPFDDSAKFILVSDCHRGDSSWADDFAPNQNIFFHALDHYFEHGFTYFELGDGDELWETRSFDDILAAHSHIFWKMSEFHKAHRLHLLWGNHNRKWKNPRAVANQLFNYSPERNRKPGAKVPPVPLFDGIQVREGLILRHSPSNKRILLTHGHQGDALNDEWWWLGQYFVRHLWKPLQLIGFNDPTSPARNFSKRLELEEAMIGWLGESKGKLDLLIAGHTHRPALPAAGDPSYCNTGSCVHPRGITGIEIENGEMALIKWFIDVKSGSTSALFVNRKILAGPRKLSTF